MADYADIQLLLVHNILAGFQLGLGGTTLPATDYAVTALPDNIPVGQSIKITPSFYDDQPRSKAHAFTNCTAAVLKGLPIGSSAGATTLATASTPAAPVFIIAKDTIPEEWAAWTGGVRFWFEFTDTDSKLVVWQDVTVESLLAPSAAVTYPETEDIPITTQDVTGADSVDLPAVVDGKVRIRLDMTAGNYALTLHSAANVRAAGEIEIVIVKGTGTCSVTPAGVETINEVAGAQTIQGVGSNMTLIKFDGDWILMNPSLGVD